MNPSEHGTHQKALQINLDASTFGTFGEIGAGQEVARWFFRVGGASGTIAKTISAYDMTVSDAIYGPSRRYVSHERLAHMLRYEFGLLRERLDAKRGQTTRFFAFADTVAAQSYTRKVDCHGWLGIRFQAAPGSEPSDVILHVGLWDKGNLPQQEALGILGVNLVHAALYLHAQPEKIVDALMDNLTTARVEIDMIRFSGPAFARIDNRLMSLRLVERGYTNAAMFTADGDVAQAADILHNKPILIERGAFRPITNVMADMVGSAMKRFVIDANVDPEEVVILLEMTQKNLLTEGALDHRDFLDRIDIIGALGLNVLVTNFDAFHRLAAYLFRCSRERIGLVVGVRTLQDIFEDKYYADLEGGILESFGRLFKNGLRCYVYPMLEAASGQVVTAETLEVPSNVRRLHEYLLEQGHIVGLREYRPDYLSISAKKVLARIRQGADDWEQQVPPAVVKAIKERRLLGYGNTARPSS